LGVAVVTLNRCRLFILQYGPDVNALLIAFYQAPGLEPAGAAGGASALLRRIFARYRLVIRKAAMTSQLLKDSPAATPFKIEAALLDQGRTMDLLAHANVLAAHIKVYAEGGENTIHAHTQEEHLFVLLGGEATFHFGHEDKVQILRKHEGVVIPAKSFYWFVSSGEENLILLRVGAKTAGWTDFDDRVDVDGNPFPGDSEANKEKPVIKRVGAFFS
jgi:mannose-6-phosphate isomerase-like protein (cupin superfamily)